MAIPKKLRTQMKRIRYVADLICNMMFAKYVSKRNSVSALGISQRGMAERPIFSIIHN